MRDTKAKTKATAMRLLSIPIDCRPRLTLWIENMIEIYAQLFISFDGEHKARLFGAVCVGGGGEKSALSERNSRR
jgi:hypothetical protein